MRTIPVEISTSKTHGGYKVIMDGVDISSNLIGLKLEISAGDMNVLTLVYVGVQVTKAVVRVEDEVGQ